MLNYQRVFSTQGNLEPNHTSCFGASSANMSLWARGEAFGKRPAINPHKSCWCQDKFKVHLNVGIPCRFSDLPYRVSLRFPPFVCIVCIKLMLFMRQPFNCMLRKGYKKVSLEDQRVLAILFQPFEMRRHNFPDAVFSLSEQVICFFSVIVSFPINISISHRIHVCYIWYS